MRLLFWPDLSVTRHVMLAMAINMAAQMTYNETLAGLKGEKRSNYIIEASQCLKLLLMKSTVKGSAGRAKSNRGNDAAVWHLLSGIRHWSCKKWHKEEDLAENCLALCTMDENTAHFLSEVLFFSPSGSSRLVTWLVKGTKQKLVGVFFPFYLTHSILLMRWLSKSPREKLI